MDLGGRFSPLCVKFWSRNTYEELISVENHLGSLALLRDFCYTLFTSKSRVGPGILNTGQSRVRSGFILLGPL